MEIGKWEVAHDVLGKFWMSWRDVIEDWMAQESRVVLFRKASGRRMIPLRHLHVRSML